LIERVVRNDEVVGLIPICSTMVRQKFQASTKRANTILPAEDGRTLTISTVTM
jgi:hypothetical protein